MGFQLKTDDGENKKDDRSAPQAFVPFEEDGEGAGKKPVVISTYVPPVTDRGKETKAGKILKLVIGILVALILVFTVRAMIARLNPKSEDITMLLNKTESEIADQLSLTFQDAPEEASYVHQYSGTNVTVRSAGNLSVIYMNGRQLGVKTDGKEYSMFGVRIGDGEADAERNMTYQATDNLSVLDDMLDGGNSTSYFYYNEEKNDCFLLIINDKTNRVVSMTYYYDYELVTRNLSKFDD